MYVPAGRFIQYCELTFKQYLGEEGDHCQLKAAVLCASPWNLDVSSAHLQSTWLGREVYSKTMGTSMKKLFET
jgi:predicted alpha/beta-fold hydrolase